MAEKPTREQLEQRISELEKQLNKKAEFNKDEKYRILFEKSKDAILIIENETFVDCNQATVDMLGYKNKIKFLQTHPSELSPEKQPDGRDSFTKAKEMMDLALKKGSHRFEWDHVRANGEIFTAEVLLTTISNQEDKRVIHTIWRDITDRKLADKMRQKEKETISTILESTPHGITLIDQQNKYLYVNPYFTRITGYTLKDIPTRDDWFKKVYPEKKDRKRASEAWGKDSNSMIQGKNREFKIKCKDGQFKHIEFRSTFLKDRKLSVLTDITQRKESEAALRESEERLKAILFATPDPMVIYSKDGKTEYINPAFEGLFGWTFDEIQGKRIPFVPEDQKKITFEKTKELVEFGNKVQFETKRLTKNGNCINVIISASSIKNRNNEMSKLIVILKDNSEQKQAKKELKLLNLKLKHEATHDPLTGAMNRHAIMDILRKELIRTKRRNTRLSIGLCDIDHFKLINDVYGHQVGDDALCSFVKFMQNTLRPYDLLGRYGGEEFLLIMPDSTESTENGVYERLRTKIADHKLPTRSGGVKITVSIGIANSTGDETADAMIAKADAALYRAKGNGRDQLVYAD